MAILKIMAVKDRAVDSFGRPIFVQATGQAIRSFGDEINRADPANEMYRHPDDYDLYDLGMYDEQTGKLESNENPTLIAIGKQMKERNES